MEVSPALTDPTNPMHADCPGREVFKLITGRWTLLILWSLKSGTLRFFQIRDQVEGVSERVLSSALKDLCRHGLISRHVEPSVPPKVSYSLTPCGAGLLDVMGQITGWIASELDTIEAAKRRYDES
ncbi:winged helix-turn-helix transcriptional regulator [Pseudosulfitobacter pseudonitzschiae]|uniref:winged helix-turn-helix transcriptional regulator n=1 Tax=Pseudosulfitobacter pseudonitzschiae TaxID=1402135 RepID=UPI001AF0FBD7|nr:helix-turn-helix domain-containing protein [Pseudosulfitobacter pseudonitzschiae]MBM1814308.1 helix-turn-helix transcriptional regulator [Pseudosulfitobacter pseudonitzschiae]MBM1831301.1 helix-turn-helix transcriptional regulator [Pseudosulfitobacter pseudonitzschiae]MBM1836168.1 helix-turn-helix transcriptional regulator [Pseudosulfitobacter pseudonitzschiae]MBM1841014.1 helix-turn-helix transcriptional regulator [Pseudosulfitobacter pseudonitzschiae]MBM1845882.1 helix-turn-helix transcri